MAQSQTPDIQKESIIHQSVHQGDSVVDHPFVSGKNRHITVVTAAFRKKRRWPLNQARPDQRISNQPSLKKCRKIWL